MWSTDVCHVGCREIVFKLLLSSPRQYPLPNAFNQENRGRDGITGESNIYIGRNTTSLNESKIFFRNTKLQWIFIDRIMSLQWPTHCVFLSSELILPLTQRNILIYIIYSVQNKLKLKDANHRIKYTCAKSVCAFKTPQINTKRGSTVRAMHQNVRGK